MAGDDDVIKRAAEVLERNGCITPHSYAAVLHDAGLLAEPGDEWTELERLRKINHELVCAHNDLLVSVTHLEALQADTAEPKRQGLQLWADDR